MTRERLQAISLEELQRVAQSRGLADITNLNKASLIEIILETFEEFKKDREAENNLSIRGEEKKYDITNDEELECGYEEFPIPSRYNETKVVLMVRDPHWAYAYWDIEDRKGKELEDDPNFEHLVLRVYDVELVEFDGTNSNSYFDIPIQLNDTCWYIYLPHECCHYLLELGYFSMGKYCCLCRSNKIRTPRGTIETSIDSKLSGVLQLSEFESLMHYSSADIIPQRIISIPRE